MSRSANSSASALSKIFGGAATQKGSGRPKQDASNRPRVNHQQPTGDQQFLLGATGPPTSLANLAQLSGLNLLPINASLPLSSTDPSTSSGGLIPPHQFFDPMPASTKPKEARAQKPRQQQKKRSSYNVASMPLTNIDMLMSDSDTNYDWLNTGLSHPPISKQQSRQPQQKTNTTRNNKRNNNTKMTAEKFPSNLLSSSQLYHQQSSSMANSNQSLQLNDLHVIPVSEGLSLSVNAVPDYLQKPSPQSQLPPPASTRNSNCINNDIMMSERTNNNNNFMPLINEPFVNIEGDSNNISLIKLMSILNNPALTITPVANPLHNNSQSNNLNSTNPPNLSSSYSSQTTLSIVDDQCPRNSFYGDSYADNLYKRSNSNGRARIPQSTANLQLIDASNNIKLCNNKNTASSNFTTNVDHSSQLNNLNEDHQESPGWILNSTINCKSSYDQLPSDLSKGLLSKTFQQFSGSSLDNDYDTCSRDHLEDPLKVSDPSENSSLQEPKDDFNQSSVSVQLLKHIADQTKDNSEWKPMRESQQELIVEPECILSLPPNIQHSKWGAKSVEKILSVSSEYVSPKKSKQQLKTSTTRLYIPPLRTCIKQIRLDSLEDNIILRPIKIENLGEKEVFISEYHDMLDKLMSNAPTRKFTGSMPEPDEIFINRSKRVMSRIDVMLERKKKRRFERIMSKSEPKTSSIEVQCAESEDEWSEDEEDVEYSTVIKTQLPLCENESLEKRKHLSGVGLVSRSARNDILVDQCENRLQIFSPLSNNEIPVASDNVKRLVDTLIKTGGVDVEMRVDSDIKRNDVPILEGLNRNTSRLKMNYMNTIGLEKRSKRTTLYKIKQYMSSPSKMSPNKIKSPLQSKLKVESVKHAQRSHDVEVVNSNNGFTPEKLHYATCAETLQLPSKDEYMKSLGLMVS